MNDEVTRFEETILFFADAHRLYDPGSKLRDPFAIDRTPIEKSDVSGASTPPLTTGISTPLSISSNASERSSFGHRLPNSLLGSGNIHIQELPTQDNDFLGDSNIHDVAKINIKDLEAWQLEAVSVDRAVQILPGVKRVIDSIPAGRYAVATSGTKSFGDFTCLIFSCRLIIPPFASKLTAV